MTRTMRHASLWNGFMALVVAAGMAFEFFGGGTPHQEIVFVLALALFHGIFAIWFAKGSSLVPFARVSVWARLISGVAYASVAFLSSRSLTSEVSRFFGVIVPVYSSLHAVAELLGAWLTHRSLGADQDSGVGARRSANLHEKNRLVFACYMVGIGLWLLFGSRSFLAFFRLPNTLFSGRDGAFGPIHLLGVQILILALYNLVAVRERLEPLIAAGMRGGLITCVFFFLLVAVGLLHPLTLLLPAADLISIAVLVLARLSSHTARH